MSLFSDAQNALKSGFGQSLLSQASSATGVNIQQAIGAGSGIIDDIQNGNLMGAGTRVLGEVGKHFNSKTAMFGGFSASDALNIYNKQRGINWCRKNLWIIEVSSELKGEVEAFNMFAFNVDFSPFTITGEKKQIGAAHVDMVNSSDPVELSLTTYDDTQGTIKQWFEDHATVCAASDGTVGVPNDYAIKIKIIHGFITGSSGYVSKGLFRTGNITLSLSRSEQALSEVTMSFVQLDTFMSA